MPEPARDTIFALSSGRGPAAIAIVRISGPRAGAALKALSGKIPAPRQVALARIRDPADNRLPGWFQDSRPDWLPDSPLDLPAVDPVERAAGAGA